MEERPPAEVAKAHRHPGPMAGQRLLPGVRKVADVRQPDRIIEKAHDLLRIGKP